jgi:CIC family chloride channel protein
LFYDLVAIIYIFHPLFGEGFAAVRRLSSSHPENILQLSPFSRFQDNAWILVLYVAACFLLKPIATAITISGGGNGGNFAPSLFVGALSGFVICTVCNLSGYVHVPVVSGMVAGMAGMLSGLYHAPLTAIFLIAEMTGGYGLMIPLMLVSSISFAVSRYFEPYSMDLRKLAKAGKAFTHDRDFNILGGINPMDLVETEFRILHPQQLVSELLSELAIHKRSVFPVVDGNGVLIGIVAMESLRPLFIQPARADELYVKDLMQKPAGILDDQMSMSSVMKAFDDTGAWNLPLVSKGMYLGFISKSSILTRYRQQLKSVSIN